MKQNEHGRILGDAAKRHLAPLGCKRRGQSRTWISDHGFWLIVIEFQPSGWSKGSYLNVGACWLWSRGQHLSFHYGSRIADFVEFESIEQFAPEADRLACRAADEVQRLRRDCSSIKAIARLLMLDANNGKSGWPLHHAAVAAGLIGDLTAADQLFDRVRTSFTGDGWQAEARAHAAHLQQVVARQEAFKSEIMDLIEQKRAVLKLPSWGGSFETTA